MAQRHCSGITKTDRKRMIYAIGETVMDILFKEDKPIDAVPGGSAFNSIISVGRTGRACAFIGYTGKDHVGALTTKFLRENGVGVEWFEEREGVKSCVSLAFLDEKGDAHYVFYKDTPQAPDGGEDNIPRFGKDDTLLFGSYYAVCRGTRGQVRKVLEAARAAGATIYYDINFRSSHKDELQELMPAIEENCRLATVVRGSADDFDVMWGMRNAREIYERHIAQHCEIFICTAGEGQITVCTPDGVWEFEAPHVEHVVSTVGAGDSFNAGFLCALAEESEKKMHWSRERLKPLIERGTSYAAEVCQSTNNYIDVQKNG